MRHFVAVILLGLVATAAIAKSNVPTANTHAAIKSFVQQAAKVVAKKGPSCETFTSTDWKGGDYYIFILGPDDKIVCHPNPSLVGKMNSEVVDATGKKIGVEIAANARKKGGGWTEYVWPRPGTTTPQVPKMTYSTRVKGPDGKWYVVGGGGYELK
ncbi:MAG TPA: cache domain-containing protein [Thermoanaerobaculia bacterium]